MVNLSLFIALPSTVLAPVQVTNAGLSSLRLTAKGMFFYFTIGKSALDNLLYLTVTDGYVEFVLVDVQELCSLSEQLLKLGPFDGTVNPLINVGNRCQSDEMRAARLSLTSASHSRQEQVQ